MRIWWLAHLNLVQVNLNKIIHCHRFSPGLNQLIVITQDSYISNPVKSPVLEGKHAGFLGAFQNLNSCPPQVLVAWWWQKLNSISCKKRNRENIFVFSITIFSREMSPKSCRGYVDRGKLFSPVHRGGVSREARVHKHRWRTGVRIMEITHRPPPASTWF